MKLSRMLLAAAMVFALAGCDQKPKSTTEQVKDKVNDVLDRRPNEKLRDAAEDIRDGVKEAAKDLQETAKHAGK
jgi:type IV pilus biogenesis protein CpaD/CtpE